MSKPEIDEIPPDFVIIDKGALLASFEHHFLGFMALRMHDIGFVIPSRDPHGEYEVFPANWFCRLKRAKPTTYTDADIYLTREGWNALKDVYKQVYSKRYPDTTKGDWANIESQIEAHFADVERNWARALRKAERELVALKRFTV